MEGHYWCTRLDGSAAECLAASRRLRTAASALIRAARTAAAPTDHGPTCAWTGPAASTAELTTEDVAALLRVQAARLRVLGHAAKELGAALSAIGGMLGTARAAAGLSGRSMYAGGFWAPWGDSAAVQVRAAREREDAAHARLRGALLVVDEGSLPQRFINDVLSDVLHLPPVDGGRLDWASWAVGLPGARDLLTDDAKRRLAAQGERAVARAAVSDSAVVVAAARSLTRAAPVAVRVAKASGPVGNGLTVVTEGVGQWEADADDPRLSTVDRVGRTGVRAVAGGAVAIEGALVGAEIGSSAGAAVGTLVPVLGTAVGAAVGGVVGGAAGGFLATEAGRASVDAAVETVDDVIDVAGDAGHAVAEAADAATDAISDARDKLVSWL